MDMHSGGSSKEDFEYLYIEAPEAEAKVIFYNRFGHNPERVTCTCCGDDYSISEEETLAEATAYDRGCRYSSEAKGYVEEPDNRYGEGRYIPLDQFIENKRASRNMTGDRVDFIFAADIKPEERVGDVPQQGYVWQD
jgi:hypothetical protein